MTKIRDEDYILWIKQQPCAKCGWKPEGYARFTLNKDSEWSDKFSEGRYYGSVAAHHAGDGIHSRKFSDLTTIPLCDSSCDPAAPNCHHECIHRHPKEYNEWSREKAVEYRRLYASKKPIL